MPLWNKKNIPEPASKQCQDQKDRPWLWILQIEEKEPGRFRFLKDTEEPLSGHALDVSYAAEDADACSACYSSLIGALFRLEEEGLLSDLKEKIGIGQGMCGKTGNLGVGKCTAAFKTSSPGCPPDEEAIYAGLREYILSSR